MYSAVAERRHGLALFDRPCSYPKKKTPHSRIDGNGPIYSRKGEGNDSMIEIDVWFC